MADPMAKGNFIVLKGDKRASGKHLIIEGAVQQFLNEDEENTVVYVSLTKNSAQKLLSKVEEKNRERIALISADAIDAE